MSYVRSGVDSDVYVYGTYAKGDDKRLIYQCHTSHSKGHRFDFLPYFKDLPVGWRRSLLVKLEFSKFNNKKFKHRYAGKSFTTSTPGGMALLLETLRDSGLKVPQYPIDRLREEANEGR